MQLFVNQIEKGYLKQAESTINILGPHNKGFTYNTGLLNLLKGNAR